MALFTVSDVRAAAARLPRFPLAQLPTPLEYLPRFSQALGGPRIYIKRDDCTGLAYGGNKARHNEFLMGDALAQQAELLVWGAGVQSNNCRQTAAACAKAGLPIHLVLGRGGPVTQPEPLQGNLLLDYLLGAHIEIVPESVGPALEARITEVAETYRRQGRRVYAWHRNLRARAAVSYVLCACELVEQTAAQELRPAAVYVSSAGSTGAGLAVGRAWLGLDYPILNIAPLEWPWDIRADLAEMCNGVGKLLGLPVALGREDIDIRFDQIAPGYGALSPAGAEALALLARTEGILLDHVYTAKALAGLISDVRQGRWPANETLIFIHTGGTPVLFACGDELTRQIPAGVDCRTRLG